jgi:hypothetical protein
MDYINGSTPKTIPAGKVLCHNHVGHLADTPSGTNGFRAWFDDADSGCASRLTSSLVECR